jgi:hypothetical protein
MSPLKKEAAALLEGWFSEIRGVKGPEKPYSSWSVGGRHTSIIASGHCEVRGISIPFALQWLKSSIEVKLFGKSLEDSLRVCFGGTEGSEMALLAPF